MGRAIAAATAFLSMLKLGGSGTHGGSLGSSEMGGGGRSTDPVDGPEGESAGGRRQSTMEARGVAVGEDARNIRVSDMIKKGIRGRL